MLAQSIPFNPRQDEDALSQLPSSAGIFLLRPREQGAEPYVSKAANLRRRISRLLGTEPGFSRRLNLRELCGQIEFTSTGSDFESGLLLYRTLRQLFPETYIKRLRIAPAPLIRIDWSDPYPRAYVTTKLSRFGHGQPPTASSYFGPFRSRAAADHFLNDALDLFKSRRCTFDIRPDPAFPGCVYSEMKMCLAPCFAGCTSAEYQQEMRRVEDFFEHRGGVLLAGLASERERASAALEFEAAAAAHARIEKVNAVLRECDELVRRLDQLDCVVLQRGTEKGSVALFRVLAGEVLGPALLDVPVAGSGLPDGGSATSPGDLAADGPSLASGQLSGQPPRPATAEQKQLRHQTQAAVARALEQLQPSARLTGQSRAEQLGLFKRWYYRSHRIGELVFCGEPTAPYRRIARAALRLVTDSKIVSSA